MKTYATIRRMLIIREDQVTEEYEEMYSEHYKALSSAQVLHQGAGYNFSMDDIEPGFQQYNEGKATGPANVLHYLLYQQACIETEILRGGKPQVRSEEVKVDKGESKRVLERRTEGNGCTNSELGEKKRK
eukprot:2583781-Amphidinium_carterae.1